MKKKYGILIFLLMVIIVLIIALVLPQSNTQKIVNFDVMPLDIPHSEYQEVSVFGCNNVSKNITKLEWGMRSSRELNYGWQEDGGKRFFVAQYYLASPPVPVAPKSGHKTTLGLLYSDHFKFENSEPSVTVTLDYQQLKPMFLNYVNINFGSCNGKVNTIPINTSCPMFPYQNGEYKPASGIGLIENKEGHGQIFLPTQDEAGNEPLQCNASILNDIQLNYKISFLIGESITDNLNLTQQFKDHRGIPVTLICDERPENDPLPTGCAP